MTVRACPDPCALAALHAQCFAVPRPWSGAEFENLRDDPLTDLLHMATDDGALAGFALIRTVLDEAELLTLAVAPAQRRRGLARVLIAHAMARARSRGAEALFLEVAADNTAACTLYRAMGFQQVGTRPGYYAGGASARVDALIFRRVAI